MWNWFGGGGGGGFNWGDLWSGLGGISGILGLGNLGMNAYKMFNPPSMPQMQPYQPQQPQGMQGFEPPDFSGMFEGFAEQMAAQQEALKQEQQKGLARSASSARKALQSQGVTWDPENPEVGAGGVDAIASQLNITPDELLAALKQYGGEFGFEGFGQA